MRPRFLCLLAVLVAVLPPVTFPGSVMAQESGAPQASGSEISVGIADLSRTMRMGEVVEIMRAEGVDYGASLADEMFAGQGGAEWQAIVSEIYDPVGMLQRFDLQLAEALADDAGTRDGAMQFFGGAQGQRILTLELDARRLLADDAAEEAAKVKVEDMIADNDPRMEVLRTFAEANDLIELNVAGALNANLAFYRGMQEGGAFGAEMTEDQMLSDVWSQEPEIRAETEAWLYSYLALAYAPLSDADLADYIAYSETPEGQRFNLALFSAFDAMFEPISHELGLAAARQMQGQDI
jgi:hypothetical protein